MIEDRDSVSPAIEALRSIAEAEIDDTLRYVIVNYVERTVTADQFSDVADWGLDLWRVSMAVVLSGNEYRHLTAFLDALISRARSEDDCETVIRLEEGNSPGHTPRVLSEILTLEELWSRLMELVAREIFHVTEYGDRLYPYYSDRLQAGWSPLIMGGAPAADAVRCCKCTRRSGGVR